MRMPDTIGKYDLRQILGKGAMGTVFEGYDPIIGRRLAIKTVQIPDREEADVQAGLERFKREAQAAGRLTHPNIVGVYDYGETPEVAYIVQDSGSRLLVGNHAFADLLDDVARTVPGVPRPLRARARNSLAT